MRREPGAGVELGLIALVVFGILAFGSTSYWARALLQAGAAVLLVAWWIAAARSRPPAEFETRDPDAGPDVGGVRFRRNGLGLVSLLFLVVVIAQLIPFPAGVRRALAPRLESLERSPAEVLGPLGSVPDAAAPSPWRPLSMDPGGTLDALWLFLAYAALFVVTYNLVDSRRRLVRLTRTLVAFGFIVALLGLLQDLSGTERVLGIKQLRFGGSPYGPFVNHNHFAGFMEMTIPLTFALLLRQMLRPPSRGTYGHLTPGGLSLPDDHDGRGERTGQVLLLVLALTVMLAALLLSLSRGGLAALLLASTTVVLLLALRGRLGRWEIAALAVIVGAGLALFLWAGPGEALAHFRQAETGQNEPSFWMRVLVWKASAVMFLDFPFLGTGLGSFPRAFQHYYPAGNENVWLQAHNDYIHLLAEMGAVGALVALAGFVIVCFRLAGPIVGRGEVRERFIYYGLCTGVLALLIHSLVDFNLRIPGNAAFFVVLLAMALAQRKVLARSGRAERSP